MSIQGSINQITGSVGSAINGVYRARAEAALKNAMEERRNVDDAFKARRLAIDEIKAQTQAAALAETTAAREAKERMHHQDILLERYKIKKGLVPTNGRKDV